MRTILIIGACFIICTAAVLLAFKISINHNKNGFIRLFPSHFIADSETLDLKIKSYYIAGLSHTKIFLGDYYDPTSLIMTDYDLSIKQEIKFNVPDLSNLTRALKISIDSPDVYIMDGISAKVLHSRFNEKDTSVNILESGNFTLCIPLSPSSFIMRKVDDSLKRSILVKESMSGYSTEHSITKNATVLKKQVDGFFCTDGFLNYSKSSGKLLYLYAYRNQFMSLDTNLTVLYTATTIDTISRAQITVGNISSENKTTMSSPPLFVNKSSCTNDEWLFVHSGLLADNESKDLFNANVVIDLYSIRDGAYQFSFYIPDDNGARLSEFKVYKDKFVGLHGNKLKVYTLAYP